MADESRSYGTFGGGKDHSALFDMIKGQRQSEQKIAETKAINEHSAGLEAKRLEKAHEFSTIMEDIRNRNVKMREQEAFARQQTQKLVEGQQMAEYTGNLAVGQAQQGNVIDTLVERRPELDTPEAGLPGYVPRPIPPYAAGAAHTDLMQGIQARRDSQLKQQEASQARLLRTVDETDIATAASMSVTADQYGLKLLSGTLKNIRGMDKDAFAKLMVDADKHIQTINMRLQNAKVYSTARVQSAEIAAEARQKVAQLAAKKQLSSQDLAWARENRLRISGELQSTVARLGHLRTMFAEAGTQVERDSYQREIAYHEDLHKNLMGLQQQMFSLHQKEQLSDPPPGPKQNDEMHKVINQTLDELFGKGKKTLRELKPAEKEKFDAAMKAKGWEAE